MVFFQKGNGWAETAGGAAPPLNDKIVIHREASPVEVRRSDGYAIGPNIPWCSRRAPERDGRVFPFKSTHSPHKRAQPHSDSMRQPVQRHARSHFEIANSATHKRPRPWSKALRLPREAKRPNSGELPRPARKQTAHSTQEAGRERRRDDQSGEATAA